MPLYWDRLFCLLFSRRDTKWIFLAICQGKQSNLSYLKLTLSVILIDNISNYLMKNINFRGSEVLYLHSTSFSS